MTRARQLADLISDGVIGTTELADDAITPVKLDETGNYTIAQLDVTGTVTSDGLTVDGGANALTRTSSGAEVDALELRNNATATNTATTLKFANSTAAGSNSGSTELVAIRTGTNTGDFVVRVADSAATMQERLRITSTGLDLGTTTDAATVSNTASDYQLQLGAAQSTTGDIGRNISFALSGTTTAAINTVDAGAGNAQSLAFFTGNGTSIAERLRITSGGNVGINNASPQGPLHIIDGSGSVSGASYRTNTPLILENNGNTELQFFSNSSNDAQIRFGDGDSNFAGAIEYKHGSDAMLFFTNGSERMRLVNQNGGDLNFGSMDTFSFGNTETQVNKFQINSGRNTTSARTHMAFGNPNGQVGSITTNGSSTAFETSSDHRLKENVTDMTGAIARVKQLAPKRFNFIADDTVTVDGFLAHEAQAVVPEAVSGTHNEVDADGNAVMQGIDQSKLVPLLTGALQESIAKIETLETEMTALKARVTALEA